MHQKELTPSRRIRLIVQYDGAAFYGWQSQAGQRTVQDELEGALQRLLGLSRRVRVTAAGRTDTGVHALAMPVHFDLRHPIPTENLAVALTKFLPEEIGVLAAAEAPPSFDARRRAILRWYRYQILRERLRRPLAPRGWRVTRPLDLERLAWGLEQLRGTHDFRGFRSSQCQGKRTVLTMEQATLTEAGTLLALDFKCRSFLHHMIRFMVGSLAALAGGRLSRERFLRILEQGERPQLAACAPPGGLCLMGVAYSEAEREELLARTPPPPSF
ncbi:MAG TPA: tRNA pseudouridine(38-40) synthase TruA [Candidatus Sumerlaeota bacterium]|nr:tRNA pseudouridine(38-40) synthase TruA [Candidatus Sumerlaeota bacterium]HOR29597.1 tRNA pseudouridine(38-40) synthase TruA [Candidatus Sumerlaeota bacterium]HPK04095.1 tRNA pseudouridine(38-40) synthase TruA [Candidatus Sumerlaeota bacterium]